MKRFAVPLLFGIVPFGALCLGQSKPTQRTFSHDVEPIFRAQCLSCHSANAPSGGLDLSSAAGVKKGGDSGPLFVAGKPGSSILIKRLKGEGGLPQMPMGFQPIEAGKLAAITEWIAQGAKFDAGAKVHWAYLAPKRPLVPSTKNKGWVSNPIDAFVLQKLESKGWKPSSPASKENLIRRVSLDLTGMPPTLKEVDEFLADKSPKAYEKVVDRLLASPHFGEKMAATWLDLARYADTNGYEKDDRRSMWLWRDWVINAYNRNMPYDQFTLEQLAGDLLPNPTSSQMVATGFNRNTMLNLEGGVDPDEAMVETINDRVATTSTVWLAQTMACARCHDHKYDPLSQEDYYKMFALFTNNEYEERGNKSVSEMKYWEPELSVPTLQQTRDLENTDAAIKIADSNIAEAEVRIPDFVSRWSKSLRRTRWVSVQNPRITTFPATTNNVSGDQIRFSGPVPAQVVYKLQLPVSDILSLRALRIRAIPDPSFPNSGPGRADSGNFILSRAKVSVKGAAYLPAIAASPHVQNGYSALGSLDDNPDTGWAIAGNYGKENQLILQLEEAVRLGNSNFIELEMGFESKQWPYHSLGRFAIDLSDSEFPFFEILPADARTLLAKENRSAEEEKQLQSALRTYEPTLSRALSQKQQLVQRRQSILASIPKALVLRERVKGANLQAPLRIRGEYLQPGPIVQAGTPKVLPAMSGSARKDRLSFSKWLFHPSHPLTARVQVNRLWEQAFGRGLVESVDNFGTQGSKPSHPELLDWLATEFIARKWDQKAMLKLMVMSNAYRQSSAMTAKQKQLDPQNVWLGRANRYRLPAESIRDTMLSSSGLLVRTIGGPSVFPFQPEGVWNTPYSGDRWIQSPGPGSYRRGIYTFIKRTSPYPAFVNFDASSREQCLPKRTNTNTPIQALTLLNDQVTQNAAFALANRLDSAQTLDQKARLCFRLALGRKPKPAEQARIEALYVRLVARYRATPVESKKIAPTPEGAAWTMVASALFNLDEAITRE